MCSALLHERAVSWDVPPMDILGKTCNTPAMAHETLVIHCATCACPQVGTVIASYVRDWDEYSAVKVRASLVRCPKCWEPFLAEADNHEYSEGDGWSSPTFLYPGDPSRLDSSVPSQIGASFIEARRAFERASAYTGAALMCRGTLEGICKHYEAKGGNLKTNILWLKDNGVTPCLFEWSDEVLRSLGNDAAHDVDAEARREDAKDALDFTKALLECLFVFQAAYQRFKERRERPKGTE